MLYKIFNDFYNLYIFSFQIHPCVLLDPQVTQYPGTPVFGTWPPGTRGQTGMRRSLLIFNRSYGQRFVEELLTDVTRLTRVGIDEREIKYCFKFWGRCFIYTEWFGLGVKSLCIFRKVWICWKVFNFLKSAKNKRSFWKCSCGK